MGESTKWAIRSGLAVLAGTGFAFLAAWGLVEKDGAWWSFTLYLVSVAYAVGMTGLGFYFMARAAESSEKGKTK